MNKTIHVPDVCERDIDLLLLEEFVASENFRAWFLSQLGINEIVSLVDAARSVTTASGESDLEFTVKGLEGNIRVLVENKVDAAFQPRQAERYAERADDYLQNMDFAQVITVLVAPEVYFSDDDDDGGFNYQINYEQVLEWFSKATQLGDRREYKLYLLERAIDRGRHGWKLIPDEKVSAFWRSYWELVEQVAPQLSMPVPKKEIPQYSNFVHFRPPELPPSVSLVHKARYGNVDLQFSGMGDKLDEMHRLYRKHLVPPMRIEMANKSAVIRIRIEPFEMSMVEFSEAEDIVRKAIEAAITLLDWYVSTEDEVSTR